MTKELQCTPPKLIFRPEEPDENTTSDLIVMRRLVNNLAGQLDMTPEDLEALSRASRANMPNAEYTERVGQPYPGSNSATPWLENRGGAGQYTMHGQHTGNILDPWDPETAHRTQSPYPHMRSSSRNGHRSDYSRGR